MQKSKVKTIEEKDFDNEVLKSDKPVFVDFYADWCGPCRIVAPVIEELSAEYDGKVKFVKVNVDFAPDISSRYNIMSIPTLMVFKEGKPVKMFIGAATKKEYKQIIEEVLNS
jgi:thioredoxin 1